ncbi:MAG: succinylglutamate desuccinylase/aspartoacylase family protein [Pseudomonadota bacterium]
MQQKAINTRSLISGDTLTIPYFEWDGGEGPSVFIQAGIHGQEYMGYGVALCLIEHFKNNPPTGKVTIVPKANPYGMNVKMGDTTYGRFDPTTGANWNRNYANWLKNPEAFTRAHQSKSWPQVKEALRIEAQKALTSTNPQSYQNKLAYQLQNLAVQHDILLDLHCDGISLPYIYCQDYALDYARQLKFDYHLTARRHFKESFDDASIYPFWTVFEQMGFPIDQLDMMAFTLELGSKEYFDLPTCQQFSDRIVQFLKAPYKKTANNLHQDACDKSQFIDIYSPQAGMLYDFAPLGKLVPAGEPLCLLLATHNEMCPLNKRLIPLTHHLPCTPIARTPAGSVHEGVSVISCVLY